MTSKELPSTYLDTRDLAIKQIEAIPVLIPLIKPIKNARFEFNELDNVIVIVTLSNGVQGIADAPPRPAIYGETQKSIIAVIKDHFSSALKGVNAFDVGKVWRVFDGIVWNLAAKGAIDMALYDAQAKTLGIPCAALLGGIVKPLPVNWRIRLGTQKEMLADAADMISKHGFKALKAKCGTDAQKDLQMLSALRKMVGEEVEIAVDMNQGYTSETLLRVLPDLEELHIALIEEPIPARDHGGKLLVANNTTIPISGDDSCMTPEDVFDELRLGAIRSVVIKCARGGYTASRQIAAISRAYFRPVHNGSQADVHIGTAAAGHFACSYTAIHAHEISGFLDVNGRVSEQDLAIKNGNLMLPEGPGIGLTLDQKMLNKYRIDN